MLQKNNPIENNTAKEQPSDLVKENEDTETKETEIEAEKTDAPEDVLEVEENPEDTMILESNYIAKVKKIKKGKDSYELKVLENLKGNLNAGDIPGSDKLLENRTYLVFLKNKEGNTVFTNEAEGLILLEGDNHEIFEKINKQLHN